MDYEQKYKKALSFLKDLKHHMSDYCIEKLEGFFPELRESEDERIRKEIIKLVHFFYGSSLACKHFVSEDNMIAWLEKQGMQKPAEFDDTNAKRMFIKALERVEEQNSKGYKLTDCDKNSWWEDFKAYTSCAIEQKPAWSEEDEKMLDKIIDELTPYGECPDYPSPEEQDYYYISQEMIDWLKSVKDRVQPQSKQEWSEEDEKFVVDTMNFLYRAKNQYAQPVRLEECIDWLKSLRLHTPLKPNDDEINEAANQHEDSAWCRPLYMEMLDGQPNGVKESVTTHADSFKAGVEWLWNKIQGK